ncbi:MAG: hypothetical protein ACRDT4_26160, partial [Micromonosporaceae bacterium]
MALWRDELNLQEMYDLMMGERYDSLEWQIRGWAALGELFLEQHNKLQGFKTSLSQVWTSQGGTEYLTYVDRVIGELHRGWEVASGNALAIDRIRACISATQETLNELLVEFDNTAMADAERQYNEDMDDIRHSSWTDRVRGENTDTPTPPDRVALMESEGYNDAGGSVMDEAAAEIMEQRGRIENPSRYTGPLNSMLAENMGMVPPAPPSLPSAPAAPAPPAAPAVPVPPPAAPVAPVAPAPPAAPAPPTA